MTCRYLRTAGYCLLFGSDTAKLNLFGAYKLLLVLNRYAVGLVFPTCNLHGPTATVVILCGRGGGGRFIRDDITSAVDVSLQ